MPLPFIYSPPTVSAITSDNLMTFNYICLLCLYPSQVPLTILTWSKEYPKIQYERIIVISSTVPLTNVTWTLDNSLTFTASDAAFSQWSFPLVGGGMELILHVNRSMFHSPIDGPQHVLIVQAANAAGE